MTTQTEPKFDREAFMAKMAEQKKAHLASLPHMAKPHLPGYIVLGKREGGNTYALGTVENSFSLDTSPDRTQFFWSSDNASSNFGGRFKVDGKKMADDSAAYWAPRHPDVKFEVFDVHSPECPVLIDWDAWRAASARSDKTLSGVVDKFGARNVKFYDPAMLED